ncbi:MAG: nucleotide exchange factor GrpE [Magnetococcales bacterium]|nr:nucleotide exchange factor GrpE [Magnetococcales bacterium]
MSQGKDSEQESNDSEDISPEDIAKAFEQVDAGNQDEDDQTDQQEHAGSAEDQEDLQEQLALAEGKVEALKNEFLRARADMDNLRKRTAREKEQARKFAVEGFAKDLLSVADNMERALAAMPDQEEKDTDSGALEALRDGVVMVQNELNSVFTKHGVTRVEAMDQPFDPNLHQAMMQIENDEVDPDTVVQEMQAGYMLNERLLRPAMVGISKRS